MGLDLKLFEILGRQIQFQFKCSEAYTFLTFFKSFNVPLANNKVQLAHASCLRLLQWIVLLKFLHLLMILGCDQRNYFKKHLSKWHV